MVLVLIGMGVAFIIMKGMDNTQWFHPRCNHVCLAKQLKGGTPPLLIISLSGFSRDYLDHVKMLTLERMKRCGATVDRVLPSFPLKTYPNHATIVTGFYPGRHGIGADNKFVWGRNKILESFRTNMSKEHFKEEPIWSLLSKVKRDKTASLFWPGPFAKESDYVHPAYHAEMDPTVTDSDQFNYIVRWLKMPPKDRPGLIMVHLDYLKHIGLYHNSEQQVYESVLNIDALLGRLFTKLHRENFLHCLNIAIVSDADKNRQLEHAAKNHGKKWIDVDCEMSQEGEGMIRRGAKIVLQERGETKWFVNPGPIATLHLKPDSKGMIDAEALAKEFQCTDEEMLVHTRNSQPPRWYYKNSQMSGELILVGRDGAIIVTGKDDSENESVGNFGADYTDPSTHTIFFAMGPSVKKGVALSSIQNVEFMNFWAALLDVDCVENDGDKYIMEKILKKHPSDRPKVEDVRDCDYTPTGDVILCGKCNEYSFKRLERWLDQCKGTSPIIKPIIRAQVELLCYMPICNVGILRSGEENTKSIIEVYDIWGVDGLAPHVECPYVTQRFDEICPAENNSSTFQSITLSAYPRTGIANHRASVVLLKKAFIKTYFKPLNAYTVLAAGKLRKIVSITGVVGKKGQELPEYIYRILISCPNGWAQNGLHCQEHSKMDILSFLFPHLDEDYNCLDRTSLLLQYTARLKDIELLAGYSFQLQKVPEAEILRLRLHTPYKLW